VKHRWVLIADAHRNLLRAVSKLLQNSFDSVIIAEDGGSLLAKAKKWRPDLIIVDLSLPYSGSVNILRRLRLSDSLPNVKIVVLSVHDEVEVVREMFAAGATGFVLKWAVATDLLYAVREVLEDRIYVSSGIKPEASIFRE